MIQKAKVDKVRGKDRPNERGVKELREETFQVFLLIGGRGGIPEVEEPVRKLVGGEEKEKV